MEAISPGAAGNPQNVKHVEAILPESRFEEFFPTRNAAYTYTNFLKAVGKYPAICRAAAQCSRVLANMFAHFQQETAGLNSIVFCPSYRTFLQVCSTWRRLTSPPTAPPPPG